ncbi:hypothetical protein M409DRAFT_29941 [Zasmidium cellare ATCC 36951]|uniref:Alpha/beta hydrolase fold-3 domain-containing protein n=1 Tax=Zasmidium cellare ATCC 36951 TaxID=1080233 RepID=A0A6A6C1C3_ZASCE|nr:uncharacterized protein M409DRAFT_29941 [Zasmidium cellare ATCC 36951]KAF2159622.1 hypothetical protein M409DRAFT_29941 [Zasmidium cellare ATCC 36951]
MLLSKEEREKAVQPDPQIVEYLKKNPPGERSRDPLVMRKVIEAMEKAALEKLGPIHGDFEEFIHDIEMRDGYVNSLKVIKPRHPTPGPLVVLAFGGGFAAGSKDQLTDEARTIAKVFEATVVNIDYRLTPENKFPTGQLDAWDSLKWIAENTTGSILNADPTKGFIMGGVSAGGAITAVLSRKFQEEKIAHPFTGQWLAVPTLLDDDIVPEKYKEYFISGEQNAKVTEVSKEERLKMRQMGGWDRKSDLGWAGNSTTPLSGQPRTYFQVDGQDTLRDDALIYEEMLKEAGVPTKIDFYPGCPHAHWMLMPGIEISDRARIDTIAGFAWLLGKSVSREEIAKVLKISS